MNDIPTGFWYSLINTWDEHNKHHTHCYYIGADQGWCPSEYDTLRDWLAANGLHYADTIDRIFGRDLNEPNFRSRIISYEIPVKVPIKVPNHSQGRRYGESRPVTQAPLSDIAQEALGGRMENEQATVDELLRKGLDYLQERLNHIDDVLSQVLVDIDALTRVVERVEDASSGPVSTVNIQIDSDATEELADAIGAAVEKALNKHADRNRRIKKPYDGR